MDRGFCVGVGGAGTSTPISSLSKVPLYKGDEPELQVCEGAWVWY